ncbi:CoA ester lyase [Acuticoccus sp. M5D2P5]|uniref:HpcH/HpaI aldolase/citrate lyase family protein n=1 Tax=Acuticoccus kalidii TaxID=2910977 RepID=UPI001F23D899|nr:CoA ester lyase [Acuticoccus kalidii]MCF3932641.1 CoA ester lyase [Acuticoccus kalidii]
MKPNRTYLFVPGTEERKTEKALASSADALILDLEDAVAISEKPRARDMVRERLRSVSPERQVFVRVNDMETGMTAEDLRAVCVGGIAGIILPKVEGAETIRSVSKMIDNLERAEGLPAGRIVLNAIIETGRGIAHAVSIAEAGGRLNALMFGAGDYTADIGIPTANVGPHILHGKIATVIASRAGGLAPPIDTVFFDVTDAEGLAADCAEAKALGYFGKAVIHPNQIETTNAAFTPDEAELAGARRIVDSFREAEARGLGAVTVDGKLVDYAMVKTAEKTLERAR